MEFEATRSDDYALIDTGSKLDIKLNEPFVAFAYILPYDKGNMLSWCDVENSGSDVESWGNEFKIEHYLIVEIKFFD